MAVRQMAAMGTLSREQLECRGWQVINKTPLPVCCFIDQRVKMAAPEKSRVL